MKKILITILFLSSFIINGQKKETFKKLKSYEKGAELIVLKTSDPIDEAFDKIASYIMDYGLSIDNSDRRLNYLNTGYTSLNTYDFRLKIKVRLMKNDTITKIVLRGDALKQTVGFTAVNNHKKMSVIGVAFAQLFEFAEMYDNATITVENSLKN